MIRAKVVCSPIFSDQVQIRTRMAQIDSVSICFGVVFAAVLHCLVPFRVSVFFCTRCSRCRSRNLGFGSLSFSRAAPVRKFGK